MPTKGVYSHIIEPNRFVSPLDINVYQQGQQYKEGIAKENLQLAASAYGQLSNIPAYGVDAMQLQKEMEGIKSQFLSGNMSNLNDPNTFSHINSIINNAKNNPNIQAIAKRGSIYSQELEKKKKADEKGEPYTSPALDTLQEYYFNNDNFYEKPEGVNLSMGWVSPDLTKVIKQARESATKTTYNPSTGRVEKVAHPEEVSAAFKELIKNNPNYQKDLDYAFQKETKGMDWDTEGNKFILNKVSRLQQQYNQAINMGDLESAKMAEAELNRVQSLSDPTLVGNELKNQYYQNYIQTQLDKVGYANEVADFEKFDRDPLQMQIQKFANEKALKKIEHDYRMSELKIKEEEKAKVKQLALSTKDPLKKSLVLIGIKEGLSDELLDDSQPDGIKTTEELIKMGLKQEKNTEENTKHPIREDIASFRQIFKSNQEKVKKLIESKLGGNLGVGGFNENDIEKVTWNKDTNRYVIDVDDSWYGTNETISLTQDEVNNLNKVIFKKGDEVLEIPLSDTEAIDAANKEGYTKE